LDTHVHCACAHQSDGVGSFCQSRQAIKEEKTRGVEHREQKVAPPMPSGPERINLPPASVSFDIKEPPCTGRTKLPAPRRLLALLAAVGRDGKG